MEYRRLGRTGLMVSELCLGTMTFGRELDEEGSKELVGAFLEGGGNFLDTADVYEAGLSEEITGRALKGVPRDSYVLATKVRFPMGEGPNDAGPSRKHVLSGCDASLSRLGVEHIDLYYQHRVDPQVPIEETVGAMKELVEAGKVRFLGLSEAGPETLRRANAVHRISALQTEYSLFTRDAEAEVLPACRELGVGFVAYSPLGRGFLTGVWRRFEDLPEDDTRSARFPRFSRENFEKNVALAERVRAVADERGATPGQLALAWLLAQGEDIVPIPGTKRRERLEENAKAAELKLSQDDLRRLEEAIPAGSAAGARYAEQQMRAVNR